MPTLTPTKPLTSSELGTIWMTYMKFKMKTKFLEYFIEKSKDDAAKTILSNRNNNINKSITEIEQIFNNEGVVIPVAFANNDIRKDAPPLFDDFFPIIFDRWMTESAMGLNSLHLSMSHRDDIIDFYRRSWIESQVAFDDCTKYLLEKGVLARPPIVTMPKEVEFIENKKYMSGIKLWGNNRALNTIETAHLYHVLEGNIMGMQLMTGFAQVAKESEVKAYFIKGKELAKKIITNVSEIFLQSDIQPPSTWIGRTTDSTTSPFSDKIMMYCSNLLANMSLGGHAFGTAFSLRSDLPLKLSEIMTDTIAYSREGTKIMIKHKWLEEPPQIEDRNQLTKSRQH